MRTYRRKVEKKRRKQMKFGEGNKCDYTIFQLWELILTVIEKDIDKIPFYTWFGSARPLTLINNNLLVIAVDNIIIKETLDKYYISILQRAARKAIGYRMRFAIVAVDN